MPSNPTPATVVGKAEDGAWPRKIDSFGLFAVRHVTHSNVWLSRDGQTKMIPHLLPDPDTAEKWRTDFAQVQKDWIIVRCEVDCYDWEGLSPSPNPSPAPPPAPAGSC